MSTSAIIFMSTYCGAVTLITAYFFYRVLTTKKKEDENPESKEG